MGSLDISVKPLVAGERLSREEFLGRWYLLPEVKFAELIRGVVYMPSPVGPRHGVTDTHAVGWIWSYASKTPGCETYINTTWLMLQDAPQPDVALRILPEYGGPSGQRGELLAGAPEFIVETSATSTSLDLGVKKDLYEQAGVLEYVVVMAGIRVIWYRLESGRYMEIPADRDGMYRSTVFPGLWLDPQALLAGDVNRILEVLKQGLAAPEHAAFVAELAAKKA